MCFKEPLSDGFRNTGTSKEGPWKPRVDVEKAASRRYVNNSDAPKTNKGLGCP